MLKKEITYNGQKAILACDGKCDKAWGINNRPRTISDNSNEDDYAYLSDTELGIAPTDPGTYEGDHAKPTCDEEKLNKWCARECERSTLESINRIGKPILLSDFNKRVHNIVDKNTSYITVEL